MVHFNLSSLSFLTCDIESCMLHNDMQGRACNNLFSHMHDNDNEYLSIIILLLSCSGLSKKWLHTIGGLDWCTGLVDWTT